MKITKQHETGLRNKIFISYSHKDNNIREEVKNFLKFMQFEGLEFDFWSYQRINKSENLKQQIENALAYSNIAVLIIPNAVLISDIFRKKELSTILEKSDHAGTKVICLIARQCRFLYNSELSKYQFVNSPNKPLTNLSQNDREIVMLKLTEDIEKYLN